MSSPIPPTSCRSFFFNAHTEAPTKKAVCISAASIALGVAAAAVGTLALLTIFNQLPQMLSFCSPIGAMTFWGGVGAGGGGVLLLLSGVVLAIALASCKRKKTVEQMPDNEGSLVTDVNGKPLPRLPLLIKISMNKFGEYRAFLQENEFITVIPKENTSRAVILTRQAVEQECDAAQIEEKATSMLALHKVRQSKEVLDARRVDPMKEAEALEALLEPGEYVFHKSSSRLIVKEPNELITEGKEPGGCWHIPVFDPNGIKQASEDHLIGYRSLDIEALYLREPLQDAAGNSILDIQTLLKPDEYALYQGSSSPIIIRSTGAEQASVESLKRTNQDHNRIRPAQVNKRAEERENAAAPLVRLLNEGQCFYYAEGQCFYGVRGSQNTHSADSTLKNEALFRLPTLAAKQVEQTDKLQNERGYTVLTVEQLKAQKRQ